MRSVISRSATSQRHRSRRVVAVGVLSAAVVAVMVDPGPAQAATIPTPPSVCRTTSAPGAPVLTSLTIKPTSVNVKAGDKKLVVSAHATDSTKKVTSVSLYLQSPKIHGVVRTAYATLKLGKGQNAQNGSWSGAITIHKWTNNGTWQVLQVFLNDAGGGFSYYTPTGLGTHPWNNAWPKTVTVVSTPDTMPPVIKSVKLAPAKVDTSSSAKKITVTIKATDSQSGVGAVYAQGNVIIKGHSYSAYGSTSKKKSGTIKNGTWVVVMTVHRWAQAGSHVWKLTVSAYDKADAFGNNVSLNSVQLKAKHFASSFTVKSKTDLSKPVLKGLTYTPHSVDARTKNKTVAVTLKATDTLSGILYAVVTIKSPSGLTSSGFLSRHSGSTLKGTFTGKVIVPRCSEPGVWTVSAQIVDLAGNVSTYSPAQLKAKHFGSTLSVKALDTIGPTVKVPAKVSAAGPVTLTFSEATLWKNPAASTLDVYDYNKSGSPQGGTWTCKTAAGTTVTCDANNANVKTASFTPSSAFGHGDSVYVQPHQNYPNPVGIYDTTGNAISSVYLSTTVT
jgi:hypothetical protein